MVIFMNPLTKILNVYTLNKLQASQFRQPVCKLKNVLSHDIASRSDMNKTKNCNKIDKPLVIYIFSRNVMMSIVTLRKIRENLDVSHRKCNV